MRIHYYIRWSVFLQHRVHICEEESSFKTEAKMYLFYLLSEPFTIHLLIMITGQQHHHSLGIINLYVFILYYDIH